MTPGRAPLFPRVPGTGAAKLARASRELPEGGRAEERHEHQQRDPRGIEGGIEGSSEASAEARIAAASFLTSGCPASIATSSVATELLTGLTLSEAEALTRDDFAEAVGGLPKPKLHCSVLAQAAVRNAITEWRAGDADSR